MIKQLLHGNDLIKNDWIHSEKTFSPFFNFLDLIVCNLELIGSIEDPLYSIYDSLFGLLFNTSFMSEYGKYMYYKCKNKRTIYMPKSTFE
jgi:hypothetical protein